MGGILRGDFFREAGIVVTNELPALSEPFALRLPNFVLTCVSLNVFQNYTHEFFITIFALNSYQDTLESI